MIPEESRTSRIEHLASLTGDLSDLEPLTESDFCLIGKYVQLYNFIELNMRRSVEALAAVSLLDSKHTKEPARIPSAQLVTALKHAVSRMDPAIEDIQQSHEKLDELELRRKIRNLLAHWAAKRIPGEDAIILFSKSGHDEKQISGRYTLGVSVTRTAFMDLADIRGMIEHLGPYEVWLAQKTSEWHHRYYL